MLSSVAKKVLTGTAVLLVIGIATWAADFRLALDGNDSTSMVLLADDWAIYGDLIWGETRSESTKIREIFLESWEGRPLRAIEYVMLAASYQILGFHGGFWLQMAILTLSGALFASLLKRQLPGHLAILGGLLVVLHPADTTHIWLATMMAKLGLVYALLALHLFVREKFKLSAVLLIASFMSYEIAPLIFALAPFVADGGSKKSTKTGIIVFGVSLSLYLAWRFFVFVEASPDIRFLLFRADDTWSLWAYLTPFATTMRDLLVVTTTLTPLMPPLGAVLMTLAVAAALALVSLKWTVPKIAKGGVSRAFIWGLIGIAAGAALSFRAAPNASLGIASRHNIASVFGAALTFVAIVQGLQNLGPRRLGQFLSIFLGVVLIGIFGQQRSAIQQGYLDAGNFQRRLVHESFSAIGAVQPHTLIVLEHPRSDWHEPFEVMPPIITGQAYEIEAICELVYDKSVVGLCMQSPSDDKSAKTTTAHAIFAEKDNFHEIVHYDFATKKVTWVRRSQKAKPEQPIVPHGPAWRYCLGR
ncbi:MAG: hypothetical protein ACI97A_001185 [Planctomycetota bacterium]|jgi:hypothetical protein